MTIIALFLCKKLSSENSRLNSNVVPNNKADKFTYLVFLA